MNQKVVTGVKKKFFNDVHSTSFTKKLSHQLSEAHAENEVTNTRELQQSAHTLA